MWQFGVTVSIILGAVSATIITMGESDNYVFERNSLLNQEKSAFFGHQVTLGEKERKVNEVLLREKSAELGTAYKNSSEFLPLMRFPDAKERIQDSTVFQIIRKIPKGSSLHTHLLAAVSVDFIIENFTYLDNLYGGYVNNVFKLKFMAQPENSNWTLVKQMRTRQGALLFDNWLRSLLTVTEDFDSAELVWAKFKKTFTTTYDFFSYRPVFEKYVHQLLQEMYDDNVMYTEVKGTIMTLYDLDGTTYTKRQFFEIFIQEVNKFKALHPNFKGLRYIHSIYRGVDVETLNNGLDEIISFKQLFPDFIAGFDFVGYEEEGKTLLDYSSVLLGAQTHLKFFFHAGETNWFGHTDLNLADALLLNASRIGHGFGITKHPKLLELGKKRDIPFEICPISNQILMLNDDPRNHPGAVLMALDYPIVVGNDDPSVWNATGLSYDWYVVFMSMTPKDSGLEVLKQLAINSIKYSTMEEDEKKSAMETWAVQWEAFLNGFL